MRTISFSVSSINELKNRLNDTINNAFSPTIAVSFCDPDIDMEQARQLFQQHQIALVGCTTAGEICNLEVKEKTFTVLLMDMKPDCFSVVHFEGNGHDYFNTGAQLGQAAKATSDNPAIIVYSGGVGVDGDSIVKGIKSAFDKEVPIYGGLGGDHFRYDVISVYTNEGVYDNGLAALIIDTDKIAVKGLTFSGWDELGKTHTITKAEGNILLEVDNIPALDLFNSYFKGIEYQQQKGSEKLFTIPGIYPLKIKRDNGVEFLRSTLIYDFEKKALILAGAVEQGDRFKFCPTPSFDIVETTIEEFKKMASKNKNAEAIIMNSCAGRHFAFGPMFNDEVKGIYNLWDVPMVGFMAYGEIGNTGEEQICEFHNVTCSLVSLSEKNG